MISVDQLCNVLARIAPPRLAESWDNVGLLVGDRQQAVERVMTCLTLSPAVVDEAIQARADLVVVHHPLPFKPLHRITTDTPAGTMLLRLMASKVAIYSAHTAFDSAERGINQMWAERLELQAIEPLIVPAQNGAVDRVAVDGAADLRATDGGTVVGAGRRGRLAAPISLRDLLHRAAQVVAAPHPRFVGDPNQRIVKVAVACGSGGSFLAAAKRNGCDAIITGEATFHQCLEAAAFGIGLVLLGHYWSERFAMEHLAVQLSTELEGLTIWPSRSECDPIRTV
jgi:dinuclear metal center YbgI/SA1388 family protein